MTDTKKIIETARRHLEGTDLFVVECTATPGNEIELTIDSDTSVGIDACAELSRAVEAELERLPLLRFRPQGADSLRVPVDFPAYGVLYAAGKFQPGQQRFQCHSHVSHTSGQ